MAEQVPPKAGGAKSSRIVDTWKQKKWYKIISPQMFGSKTLGETVALDDSLVMGRTVVVNMANVSGDIKKQNTNIIFEVTAVKNGIAETQIKKIEINPSSVRRMVRKGRDRVDMSFVCATKDNVPVRIKPFLATKGKVGGAAMTAMRKITETVLRIEVSKISYEAFINDVIVGRLQKRVREVANKIYPLKSVEIRAFEKTILEKPLPPVPHMEEIEAETAEDLTEEEKIEKKVKAKETAEAKARKKEVKQEA